MQTENIPKEFSSTRNLQNRGLIGYSRGWGSF